MRKLLYDSDVEYGLAVLLDSKKVTSTLSKELISAFVQTTDVTRSGILATAHQYVGILGDPAVLESLDGPTSFDINALLAGEPMTIYFVIPPNKLTAYAELVRLWFTTLLHLFSERIVRPIIPTLLIIDECANLGKLDGLISAVTLMRCYGMRIWPMFQSLGQMKNIYKTDWMTIIDNCDIIQAYGIKHYPTAKEMSEIIGGITAGQLLKMQREHAVLMRAGKPVEIIRRPDYLKDAFFRNMGFQKNPFYEFSKI
jgi:type IV secretion system protein VirD4